MREDESFVAQARELGGEVQMPRAIRDVPDTWCLVVGAEVLAWSPDKGYVDSLQRATR